MTRTDTGEKLDPLGFSVSYTTGGDKSIPLKLIIKNNSVEPILKTLKIHLSERLKAKVTMCACHIWYREDVGYFSYDGGYYQWGIEQVGMGPIRIDISGINSAYKALGVPPVINSYSSNYGPLHYPDLQWVTTFSYYQDPNSSSGWSADSSQHITIKDSGGVIFDGIVNSPCKAGAGIPQDGILPVN